MTSRYCCCCHDVTWFTSQWRHKLFCHHFWRSNRCNIFSKENFRNYNNKSKNLQKN